VRGGVKTRGLEAIEGRPAESGDRLDTPCARRIAMRVGRGEQTGFQLQQGNRDEESEERCEIALDLKGDPYGRCWHNLQAGAKRRSHGTNKELQPVRRRVMP
jgi:hypothetical protein